ncbi:MAG: D-alanine--D-alanine ligase [Caldiserica bacterium]|nr:D-alanine--D-alanine ligase [Caldisericota bacterium]
MPVFHRVAVIWGGPSREREVSFRSGKRVSNALRARGYEVVEIELTRELPFNLSQEKVEAVFIAVHGKWGEDGKLQGLLEIMGLPYTGSGVLASALSMNKIFCKKLWEKEKIPTPGYQEIRKESLLEDVKKGIEKLGLPLVVKPVSEGSSLGVEIVKEKNQVLPAVQRINKEFGKVFLEEYIRGKEITVGILGEGKTLRALPVLALAPQKDFYDYQAKYTPGMTKFIIPANLPAKTYQMSQEIAIKAHKVLSCCSFSRVDMIVREDIPYVHDLNTVPGLTEISDLPAQAEAAGISYNDLIEEILSYAACNKF